MRLKDAFFIATVATTAATALACHGELEIGSPDGGPSNGEDASGSSSGVIGVGNSSGGSSSGSSSGTGVPVPGDGGIAPQTFAVNKIDLLFMIDNSASMGDKQAYLEAAIPDLVSRLATPDCVDPSNPSVVYGASTLDASGNAVCTQGSPEFPAVHDLHIGIVSSSLGPRLGDQYGTKMGGACLATSTITINGAMLNNHDDDQAHLLSRSSDPALPISSPPTETPLPDAASGFLAWFPSVAANSGSQVTPGAVAITNAATLKTDFADLMAGVHDYGCGIESQLESWYRFLIQPDPYASLALDSQQHGQWVGVDTTIIQQRHDFLRPDSLVAIVDLTDEDDSEIDVRSVGGQGYVFMSTQFFPPHGTAICATNPADPSCTTMGANDKTPYQATNDWGYDLNLRHVHMKQKYGIDPQYPLTRYQNGLLSGTVPDRTGEYPSAATSYVGTNDCTNPLFAASLPTSAALSANVATQPTSADVATLCTLPAGKRTNSLVFFLHIGGVPWQLLHFDPTNPTTDTLSAADWVRILGSDPDNYDYTGIDPHMIESYQPRTGATAPTFATATPLPAISGTAGTSPAETAPQAADNVTATNGGLPDPYNGREWNTSVGTHVDLAVDRQYACIFKLTQPRDCSKNSDGTYTVQANGYACDCSSTGLTPDELSPVCDPQNPNSQLYAKAYPTIRELELAKMVGPQGIVASICPVDVADNVNATDPLFGYRPAVVGLVNHMRPALAFAQ